jgi:Autophagy protein ATG9
MMLCGASTRSILAQRWCLNPKRALDAHERAPWNWANIYNLDAFPQEVNLYYDSKGLSCIISGQGRRSTHPASGSLQLCHFARTMSIKLEYRSPTVPGRGFWANLKTGQDITCTQEHTKAG